jgi:septal ring factor EnvC (AmiA/AmiB activator)
MFSAGLIDLAPIAVAAIAITPATLTVGFQIWTQRSNKSDHGYVVAELKQVKDQVKEGRTEVQVVKADIRDVKADVRDVKSDVGDLKTDVGDLKTDVGGIKTDVQNLADTTKNNTTEIDDIQGHLHMEFTATAVTPQSSST